MGILSRLIRKNDISELKDKRDILLTGWPATGSTYIYQLLREVCDGDIVKEHKYIIDSHRYKLKIFTIRDPRDILLSNAKRDSKKIWESKGNNEAILIELNKFISNNYLESYYKALNDPGYLIIKYEDFFKGHESILFDLLITQLGSSFENKSKDSILEKYTLSKNMKRAKELGDFQVWDKDTLLHGDHISSNGNVGVWKNELDDEILRKINSTDLGDFIKVMYK